MLERVALVAGVQSELLVHVFAAEILEVQAAEAGSLLHEAHVGTVFGKFSTASWNYFSV